MLTFQFLSRSIVRISKENMSFPIFSKYYKSWISIFSHDKKLMCLDFILQNHCYCSCQNCKPDTLLYCKRGKFQKSLRLLCSKSCILLIDSKHAYKRAPFSLKDTTTSSTKRGISREIEWSKRRDSNFFLPPHFTWEAAAAPPKTEIFRSNYFCSPFAHSQGIPAKITLGSIGTGT